MGDDHSGKPFPLFVYNCGMLSWLVVSYGWWCDHGEECQPCNGPANTLILTLPKNVFSLTPHLRNADNAIPIRANVYIGVENPLMACQLLTQKPRTSRHTYMQRNTLRLCVSFYTLSCAYQVSLAKVKPTKGRWLPANSCEQQTTGCD